MPLKEYDADTGQALPETPDALAAPDVSFDTLALDLIVISQTNPRTSFDAAKLQELADSIRSTGVMQPILVRPLPAQRLADTAHATDASQLLLDAWPHKQRRMPRPAYEIVSGERRYRASIMAARMAIPAMIRAMTDQQALEAQLVENLQRDDLHALEEADGYRRLCESTGMGKEEVGAKIGKSRTYVYQRLHLLELGQEAREAFRAGKLDFSKAHLLAGVGDPKLQLKALKEVTTEQYGGRTMSVRDFSAWLETNVMLKLKHAPFDPKDATLNPPAGVCAECPKRTGVNRDIFAAFDDPDMCTDAKCYGQKAGISLQRIKDAAAEKGMKVIAGVEAKKLRPSQYGEAIKGYTRLDEKMAGGTVAKLLGKDAPTPILFVDPHTRKQVRVLPTEVVGQLLKDKGIEVDTPPDHSEQRKKDEAKRKAKVAYETAWRIKAASAIDAAIRGGAIVSFSAGLLRLLCATLLDNVSGYDTDTMLPLWGLPVQPGDGYEAQRENTQALERHIQAAPDIDLGRMALHLMLMSELDVGPYTDDFSTPTLDLLATEAGVDLPAIQRAIRAEQKAAKAVRATPLAAQAKEEPEEKRTPAAAGAKKPRGKAAKLSAEAAKQGIADAMQDGESTSADGFAIGQRVRFNAHSVAGESGRWGGRVGRIEAITGNRYNVRFSKKVTDYVGADRDELELVQS
jgi:ParB/RepB/Spo0J family partition protein